MTPSEELRKLLDELGVEHDASEDDTTIFYDVDGNRYTYNVNPESGWAQLYGYNLTPEQAIAATVGNRSCASCPEMDNPDSYIVHLHRALEFADSGAGTCQIETTESWLPAERYHRCKRCGAFFAVLNASHDIPPRVCPNCGRRVIKEEAE